jgi:hypothetical protein
MGSTTDNLHQPERSNSIPWKPAARLRAHRKLITALHDPKTHRNVNPGRHECTSKPKPPLRARSGAFVGLSFLNLPFSTDKSQSKEDNGDCQIELPDPCLHRSRQRPHEVEEFYSIERTYVPEQCVG